MNLSARTHTDGGEGGNLWKSAIYGRFYILHLNCWTRLYCRDYKIWLNGQQLAIAFNLQINSLLQPVMVQGSGWAIVTATCHSVGWCSVSGFQTPENITPSRFMNSLLDFVCGRPNLESFLVPISAFWTIVHTDNSFFSILKKYDYSRKKDIIHTKAFMQLQTYLFHTVISNVFNPPVLFNTRGLTNKLQNIAN